MGTLQVDFGCKPGAKRTQFAPHFIEIPTPKHSISLLERMAGTTGLEPATSAVTVTIESAMDGSFWRFEARMVTVIVPLLCPRPLPYGPLPRPKCR